MYHDRSTFARATTTKKIYLNEFTPREWQIPIFDAIENKGFKKVIAIWPRRCLSGSSHILMQDGSFKFLRDIVVGDKILSWNGSSFVSDTVKNVWKTKPKKTVTVKSAISPDLVTSPDHLFANLSDGFAHKWSPLHSINKGRSLVNYAGTKSSVHNPLFARICGANGYASESDQRVPKSIWAYDEESILAFLGSLISVCGYIHTYKKAFIPSDTKSVLPPQVQVKINCGPSYNYTWDIYWLLRKIGIIPHKPFLAKGRRYGSITIGKNAYVKKLLSIPIIGKQRAQEQALAMIEGRTKVQSVINGCYNGAFSYKATDEYEELYDIETETHHNFIANGYLVHNSGKDMTAFNLVIRQALRKPCVIYYIFPTYAQGKKVLWDSITNDGKRILSYIPEEVIASKNSQEMKINLINGSLIQIVGSNDYDRLVGTNPQGCVFSEYALQDPRAYQFIRPILTANNGWALFVSTPRGKSSLWNLYQIAIHSDDWFVSKLTLDDTKHIPMEEIEKERADGIMSEDLIQQEYYTSFDLGVEGAFYSKYIDDMRLKNQIGNVPWDPSLRVNTAWDIGVRDSTSIIFFQTVGNTVRIIDFYENNKHGVEHYAKMINDKPYIYNKHIAPHDIKVREWGSGLTRIERAASLGISFSMSVNTSIYDGIEAVRSTLPRTWIDENNCSKLIKSLENYRQIYDDKKATYVGTPLHNWATHAADSMRYLCVTLKKISGSGMTAEELQQNYHEVRYGSSLPYPFN